MRRGQQTSGAVQQWAEVIAPTQFGDTGVQCHTDSQWLGRFPRLSQDRALGCYGRRQRVGGVAENGVAAVAHRLEDYAVARLDRLPQHGVVAWQSLGHRVGVLLPEIRAARDIGEEKCYNSDRQVGHRLPQLGAGAL